MAEARPDEDDESARRDTGGRVVRLQSSGNEGRPGRRKPENRLSQGPLWSLRAAIKKSTSRSSFPDLPRDRDRDRDARGPVARRPQITILSAEPLPSPCWLAGTPGAFPPPPPPAAQIWGPTIPPSIQPPPSYDEVIREKTQEQGVRISSSAPSPSSSSHPAFRTTIATQTDTGSSPGAPVLKPQRLPIPASSSRADGKIGPRSPAASDSGRSGQLHAAAPLPNAAERPRPPPRSRSTVTQVSNEVKVQTLVKLREDGLATLAARARSDVGKRDGSGGKYLQELLEAFSSDDWGVPEQRGDDSDLGQSEDEEEDMAALRARIHAFEQQQAALDGSRGDPSTSEEAFAERPEPRPRPRLQGQPAKVLPPAVAPKPKSLPKASAVDSVDCHAEVLNPKPLLITELLPSHRPSTAPCPTPVPAPRLPPQKPAPSHNETPAATKSPSRPPVAPRTSVGAPPHEKATAPGHVTPTRPPRPFTEVSRGAQTHIQDTVNLTGASLEPNPVPSKAPAPDPAPVHAKPPSPLLKNADGICEPPLPPRPSSVKHLPPRPPPIKSVPARPPPPGLGSSASQPRPQTPSSSAAASHRASKRGPPLPPRPNPGHPLFPGSTEVLIVLEDPPPEPLPSAVTPLCSTSECLLDLDVLPPAQLPESGLETCWQPAMQKHPEPPPVSRPRYVALFDFEGAEDDELSFSQGDTIGLLEPLDRQWARGQIRGRVGLFPLSFARVAEDRPPESPVAPTSSKESEVEEWAVALFDFPGQTAEDLSFHKGARIQVIEHVDSEWRRGRLAGREGLYPAAFTQACQDRPIPSRKAEVRGVAKALFAFTAEHEDELTVKPGDIITQVESGDEQWIVGVVGGKRGVVPKNYVLLL
ncbi:SH3 domain-containing protein 19-like isoform X2 [Phycodurus eques]|uniref:SH3 domain-containing protein 19-like isoform X2 n=1 Tax=Phycodurus eques TaxID=693459 RepID=UPI002ACDDE3B|nr:SH3 domain-containing protein 19-like isoform X2 [Phycodurus eques]